MEDTSLNVASEEAAVRATLARVSSAFLDGDWQRYQEFFVHEPYLQVVHPTERDWITGWDEFATRYQELLSSDVRRNFEERRSDVQVSPKGDTAWVMREIIVGWNEHSVTSWQLAVLQKVGGRWKIASLLACSLRANEAGDSQS